MDFFSVTLSCAIFQLQALVDVAFLDEGAYTLCPVKCKSLATAVGLTVLVPFSGLSFREE